MQFSPSHKLRWIRTRVLETTNLATIQIHLDHHTKANIYTSGSLLQGNIIIETRAAVSIKTVGIRFVGKSESRIFGIEKESPLPQHRFLDLDVADSSCRRDVPVVLNPGEQFCIRFSCTIPHQLQPSSCQDTQGTMVHQQHMQLPPSTGRWKRDDQMPRAITIDYGIEATTLFEDNGKSSQGRTTAFLPLLVLPFFPVQPSMYSIVTRHCHHLSHVNETRRHLLSAPTGTLTAQVAEIEPLQLSLAGLDLSPSNIAIDLGFVPLHSEYQPPDVYVKKATLQAVTHYSGSHISYIPDQRHIRNTDAKLSCPALRYTVDTGLVVEQPGKLRWANAAHPFGTRSTSDTSEETIGICKNQGRESKAKLLASVKLDSKRTKLFLPTFHSCLISRTYMMHVKLISGSLVRPFGLTIPVQISSKYSEDPIEVALPAYADIQTGQDLLPSYNEDDLSCWLGRRE